MSLVRASHVTPALPSENEWTHTERVAAQLARSTMCPPAFQNKPDEIVVAYLSLRTVGLPLNLNTLNQCYVIDNRLNMMAQLQVAVAAAHGWELWFEPGECDETKATVHYQKPGGKQRSMTYTIEEARKAHLLDEWVEVFVDTGEKWADSGKPKRRKVKVTVGVDGAPVADDQLPDWARKARQDGPPKRKDPWHDNRESMLMARACTKALRYAAPHLLLGVGDPDLGVADGDYERSAAAELGDPAHPPRADSPTSASPVDPALPGSGGGTSASGQRSNDRAVPDQNPGGVTPGGAHSDAPQEPPANNPWLRVIRTMAMRAGIDAVDLDRLSRQTTGKPLAEAVTEEKAANELLAAVRAAQTATDVAETVEQQQQSFLDPGKGS